MEKQSYKLGDRVEKFCATCDEERGHVISTLTKRGEVSRVECPQCGARTAFKKSDRANSRTSASKPGAPYDRTRTYRAGQSLTHPVFGPGEVTALIEPQKIDVLFMDRLRRLIHATPQA